jgi:hypothetical protein
MADQVQDDSGIPQEGSDGELEQLFGGQPADGKSQSQPAQGTTEQPQAESGKGQPQSPADKDWDAKKWELTYRGNKVYPKDRQHLINLAQQGWSYSQEMARLNSERQQMTQQAQRLAQYEQFDQYLRANPHVAKAMLAAAQQGVGQQQPNNNQQGPQYAVPPELMNKVGTLESQLKAQQDWHQDQLLDNEIKQLKTAHPNHDWVTDNGTGNLEKQLLQFALDNSFTNLEHAYRVMMWDNSQTEAKASALKQQMTQRQQAHQQGVVQGGAPAPAQQGQKGYQEGMSYKDAASAMMAEMSG